MKTTQILTKMYHFKITIVDVCTQKDRHLNTFQHRLNKEISTLLQWSMETKVGKIKLAPSYFSLPIYNDTLTMDSQIEGD